MEKEKRLWFRNKRYGYGWTPITWEGWLAVTFYAVVMAHIIRNIIALADAGRFVGIWVAISLGRVFLVTLALILVCYLKGEKPGWHWPKKD